jgi:hypothetical protein
LLRCSRVNLCGPGPTAIRASVGTVTRVTQLLPSALGGHLASLGSLTPPDPRGTWFACSVALPGLFRAAPGASLWGLSPALGILVVFAEPPVIVVPFTLRPLQHPVAAIPMPSPFIPGCGVLCLSCPPTSLSLCVIEGGVCFVLSCASAPFQLVSSSYGDKNTQPRCPKVTSRWWAF